MKKLKYKKTYEYLFVDGYNIINDWGIFKEENDSLENQRNKLIDILIEYSHVTREKIILVFDGYLVKKSPGSTYEQDGITVVFTREFETADHFIERELNEVGKFVKVRVATSDNVEQQMILARGGSRISAREFEIEVENAMKKIEFKQKILKEETKNIISALDEENIKRLKRLKKTLDKNK